MAQIALQIPDDQLSRVVNALCQVGGYSGDTEDQGARRAFARGEVAKFVRDRVMQAERQQAMVTAMASVIVSPVTVD